MIFQNFGFNTQIIKAIPPTPAYNYVAGAKVIFDIGNPASYPGSGSTITNIGSAGTGSNGTLSAVNYYAGNGGALTLTHDNRDKVTFTTGISASFTTQAFIKHRGAGNSWGVGSSYYGGFPNIRGNNGVIVTGNVDGNTETLTILWNGASANVPNYVYPSNVATFNSYTQTSNGTNEHKLYLNTGSADVDTTSYTRGNSAELTSYINYDSPNNGSEDIIFMGYLQYDRVLTATEIEQNFNVFANRFINEATFPNQATTTWTTTESTEWLAAGDTLTTSSYAYATSSVRIGSSYAGSAKWKGSALASNGKIYAAPHLRTDWAIIDTSADTIAVTGSVNSSNEGAVYDKITDQVFAFGSGGTKIIPSTDVASNISGPSNRNGSPVQAFDGDKLYTIGLFSNTTIQEYDISANTSTSKGSVGGDRAAGGVLAANGKCFWGNGGGSQLTEYDPATNTITNFGSGIAGDSHGPMVSHYNGFLYLFPRFTYRTIIRINPYTRGMSTAYTIAGSGNLISTAACIGLDGKIYVTRENGGVYWFNPYDSTYGEITMASSDTSFTGITMGMHGDLYLTPYNGTYFHKISLTTGAGTTADNIVQQYNFGGRMVWPG